MPFVGGYHVGHFHAVVASGHHDLIAFGLLDARIVGALDDQERRPDAVGVIEGRLGLEPLPVGRVVRVAHACVEDPAYGRPVRRNRLEQCEQVRGAHDRNAGRVQLGREGQPGQRGVAPVGAAHDGNVVRIGDATFDQVAHAVRDVVLHHARAPLLVTRVEKSLSVAGRTPEVGLQHGIAPVGQKLGEGIVPPHVARPGATVHQHHGRQAPRLDALRQRQVGRDLHAVTCPVANGLHGCQVLARKLRPASVEQFHPPLPAVVQVHGAGIHIALHRHQYQALVFGSRAQIQLAFRKLRPEKFQILRQFFGFRVDPEPVAHVVGGDQFFRPVRKRRPAEVHLALRIALHERLLAGFRIEQHQLDEISVAPVRGQIDVAAVFMEAQRTAGLFHRAGIDRRQRIAVHPENLRAAVLGDARGQAKPALQVERKAGQFLLVFEHERACAGGQVDSVHVVPARVPVVQPHQDLPGRCLGYRIDNGPRVLVRRQVARRRHARFGIGWLRGVDGVNVKVFIPALVLHVEHVAAVFAPEVAGHGPLIGRQRPGGLEGLVDAFDPDVADAVVRLEESQPAAVRRELRTGDFRVAKKQLPVQQRRKLIQIRPWGHLRLQRRGEPQHDDQKQPARHEPIGSGETGRECLRKRAGRVTGLNSCSKPSSVPHERLRQLHNWAPAVYFLTLRLSRPESKSLR